MTAEPPARIYHLATHADWSAALASGSYTTSTAGRTLAEEGFIHACRREQVGDVFARYYRDVPGPLVLLTIAPERLGAEVREERVGADTYPHIYGPLTPRAVVDVVPLSGSGRPESVASLFFKGMLARMAIVVGVMALSMLGALAGEAASDSDWARLVGAVVGVAVGTAGAVLLLRRLRGTASA